MIGEIVTTHAIIQGNKFIGKIVPSVQNNQIKKNPNTKDAGVINQISLIVSYTCNEKFKHFAIN